jgi:hypothetical protein
LTVLRLRWAVFFFAPISSSIQVGAWSLAWGRSRTQRSTPAFAEARRQVGAEQQMIDAQSRILPPVLTEIIPEGSLGKQALIALAAFRL